MKRSLLLIVIILQITVTYSQEKSNLSSTFGISKTNFIQSKKANIPFLSTTYSYKIFKNIYFGGEVTFGKLNKLSGLSFDTYNFQDYEIKFIYNKLFVKRLFFSGSINLGSNFFFMSEVMDNTTYFPQKNEILTISLFSSPEINLHYVFKNNFHLGFAYQHKIFFDGQNFPDYSLSFGVKF